MGTLDRWVSEQASERGQFIPFIPAEVADGRHAFLFLCAWPTELTQWWETTKPRN